LNQNFDSVAVNDIDSEVIRIQPQVPLPQDLYVETTAEQTLSKNSRQPSIVSTIKSPSNLKQQVNRASHYYNTADAKPSDQKGIGSVQLSYVQTDSEADLASLKSKDMNTNGYIQVHSQYRGEPEHDMKSLTLQHAPTSQTFCKGRDFLRGLGTGHMQSDAGTQVSGRNIHNQSM
jgi:hypothetical protein